MSIGIPAAPFDMPSIEIVVEGERVDLLGVERESQNLIGKLKRKHLVAIKREDPIMGGIFSSKVVQWTEADKRAFEDLYIGVYLSKVKGRVSRPCIEQDDLIK